MVWLRKNLVPEFLRKSVLYRSLGDVESFEVKTGCFVNTTEVRNDAEFRSLLLTLIHWKVDKLPADIIRYILRTKAHFLILLVQKFKSLPNPTSDLLFFYYLAIATTPPVRNDFDGFSFLYNIDKKALDVCCAHQAALVCLVHHEINPDNVWTEGTCALAAYNALPGVLQLLHERGCPWDESTCWSAVQGDSQACLQYAHEHGCPWSSLCLKDAIANKRAGIFLYLLERGCPWRDSSLLSAAEHALCARWASKVENKIYSAPTAATTVVTTTSTTTITTSSVPDAAPTSSITAVSKASTSPPVAAIVSTTTASTSSSSVAEAVGDPLRPAISAALSRLSTAYMRDYPVQSGAEGASHTADKRGRTGGAKKNTTLVTQAQLHET